MPRMPTGEQDAIYQRNLLLNRNEYRRQSLFLRSMPRCLGLVIGNACNLYCPHCYQAKNGDSLLRPPEIARELRRELTGFYPYLSTLRVQGGEVFAYPGFEDLIEDVRSAVSRPILSVSTNGTLIGERWAERIVSLPFRTVTVSIDGATPATYARLRQGGDLGLVLENVRRIQRLKLAAASDLPYLDSFFVVMRSNFRELPAYFELMCESGFSELTLQTMEINAENAAREPSLNEDESIRSPAEVLELHALLRDALPEARRHFRAVRTSGLTSLFELHGLDAAFLSEECEGLYPDSDGLLPASEPIPLCPNPWTNLFVAETGDVHLCFLSEPIGNLYQEPLAAIWNSPAALAKRSDLISGRYVASRCSAQWCSWREGKTAVAVPSAEMEELHEEWRELAGRAAAIAPDDAPAPSIASVRRILASRDQRIHELQAEFVQLCERNEDLHRKGREHIAHLEAKCASTLADFERLDRHYAEFRRRPVVRLAARLSRLWGRASRPDPEI